MGAFNPIRGHHPDFFAALPEEIGAEDLPVLNAMVAYAVAGLREAGALRSAGEARQAAVVALNVAWVFFATFRPVLKESLHAPLMNLLDGVRALDHGLVVPLLQPAAMPEGGRSPDTGHRKAVLAAVLMAVRMLQDSGMRRMAAYKLVADHLDRLGVKPSRGSGHVTERTVRGWCEKAAEDVSDHTFLGMVAKAVDSKEWRSKTEAAKPERARRLALELLNFASALFLGATTQKKPSSPPS